MDTRGHTRTQIDISNKTGGLTSKQFLAALRKVAGREFLVSCNYYPPSDGFVVEWRRTPGGMYDYDAEDKTQRVLYDDMTWETVRMFQVLWMLEG